MDSLEYYVWKAKHQRGLTDEQIAYFLDRCDRWEFLPHYARFVKKLGEQGALEEVLRMCGEKAMIHEQLRQRPQNILRKHALFRGMLSDIDRFREECLYEYFADQYVV